MNTISTKKNSLLKSKILLLSFFVILSACKVKYSLNGASIPPEAKTFSVKYFDNNAPLAPPTLSQSFSEALRDKISSQSRLTQLSSGGDLSFEGKIMDYSTSPQGIQGNSQFSAALNRLTITVSVKYTCAFDEKKNFEQTFTRFYDYPSSLTLTQVETDQTTIPQIYSQLVQDIFNKAFNDW